MTIKNLTNSPDIEEVNFSWAPDSQHLVFNSTINNQIDIFVVDLAGNSPVNLSNNPANDYGPVWVTNK
jgi:Tol biopolymer transport system component